MSALRIADFDTWRPGYGFATVTVYRAGTNTLADIFTDETLETPAPNPQTLLNLTDASGIAYGRFGTPLYTGEAFELDIAPVNRTGVMRPPLTSLAGETADLALATVTGGSRAIALNDRFARVVDVRDFGEFIEVGGQGASAATNTATLSSAIGAAGGRGGSFVVVPAGTYAITNVTLPGGGVLVGQGRSATILQSTQAGNIVTISGEEAGLARMTLDGVSQVDNSVGVFALNVDRIVFLDAQIKRFDTGLYLKGGSRFLWRDFDISDCLTGYKGRGDLDAGNGGNGGALQFNVWSGGKIELCAATGLDLAYVDTDCAHNLFFDVKFDTNTGDAIKLVGPRKTTLRDCQWTGNTGNLNVSDSTPETAENTVIGLEIVGGRIDGGTIDLTGNLEAVALRRVELKDVTVNIDTPAHNILAEDCREISGVSIQGNTPTAWVRRKTFDRGASSGLTTGNISTKAWGMELKPGQRVYLEAKIVGRGRNVVQDGFYHIAISARRPGASLAYDTQTANFTAGNIVTGQTSGATARIAGDSDGGIVGTLTVQDIVGDFVDNEIITDTGGGSATVTGALVLSDVVLAGAVSVLRAAQETNVNWDALFYANGPEIEVHVLGDTGQTVEWTVNVDVVS